VDGIYPRFAFFVSPFPDPTTEVEVTFNRLEEALRKDVERLYAVLTARFHVALHPAKYSTVAPVWPPAVKRPAAAGRRGLRVGTAAPPATPAAAVEERPPPAVMDPPAAILLRVGGRARGAPRGPPHGGGGVGGGGGGGGGGGEGLGLGEKRAESRQTDRKHGGVDG